MSVGSHHGIGTRFLGALLAAVISVAMILASTVPHAGAAPADHFGIEAASSLSPNEAATDVGHPASGCHGCIGQAVAASASVGTDFSRTEIPAKFRVRTDAAPSSFDHSPPARPPRA